MNDDIILFCKEIYNTHQFRYIKSPANKSFFNEIKKLTVCLEGTIKLFTPSRRVWHVLHNMYELPKCKMCGKDCVWHPTFHHYSEFCSKQCSRDSGEEYAKKDAKCIERYGFANARRSPIIKNKIKETMIEKYGVDNYFKSDEFSQLKKDVCVNSLFKTNVSQNHLTDISVLQSHNEGFLREQHLLLNKPIRQIANELQYSDASTIGKRMKLFNIEIKRFYSSVAEVEIREFVESLSYEVLSNCRSVVKNTELDIFIPSKNIAIEYNGLFWHCEQSGKDRNYHHAKYLKCKEQHIQLIQIFEDEYIHNKQLVLSKIQHILGKTSGTKIHARKCSIHNISHADKKHFFDKYHIQGDGPSSLNYGLQYESTLVAVIGFIKQQNGTYILNRFATSEQVVGGFSKLLTYFKNNNDWTKITTFADLRWSKGELYFNTGFTQISILPPDYSYIVRNTRVHKFNFRHKHMAKKLNLYDPNKSEAENMRINKINRIWDCGKIKFEMVNNKHIIE